MQKRILGILNENLNGIKITKSKVLVSFLALLIILLFLFSVNKLHMTLFSVSYPESDFMTEAEKVFIPEIRSGEEIVSYGYKYSNNSGVIVSAPSYVSCFWKPPKEDDGWKICEVVFEVENNREIKGILSSPQVRLDFINNGVRNVEISYSEEYNVGEEIYNEMVLDTYKKEVLRKSSGFGSEASENKKGSRRVKRSKEVVSQEIVKKQEVEIGKRKFENFNEFGKSSQFSGQIFGNLGIAGNLVSLDSENLEINTESAFAIKIRFEIPKYESNQFDFRIFESDFDAYIDPLVSGCGILNASDSIYILNQSVESIGTCFTISAENITLDCNGYNIKYGSSSNQVYGVYSTSDFITIKNCNINKSSNQIYGAGIYLEGDNSLVENNTIFNYGNYVYGISFSGAENIIRNNNIFTYDIQGHGIYSLGSDSDIINNLIETVGHQGCAVYFNSSSDNDINENIFNTSHNNAYGVYLKSGSEDNTISENQIFTLGTTSSAIYLDQESNLNLISENNISTYGEDGYGVWVDSILNEISDNYVFTQGNFGYGIYLYSNAQNNTLSKNNISTYGEDGYGVFLDYGSYNFVEDNKINTFNNYGYGILIYESDFSEFISNEVSTKGIYASSLFFDHSSNGNKISNIILESNGSYSYPIEVYYGQVNFSINDSVLNNLNEGIEFFVYGLNDPVEGPYTQGFWNFTNISLSNVNLDSRGNGHLIVKNYLEILVNTNGEALANANVEVTGFEGFSELTDSNGRTRKRPRIYYVQNNSNGSDTTYFNHSLRVSKEGYEVYESIFNMSSNQVLEVVLSEVVQVSGSSGVAVKCTPNWSCLSWSECVDGGQTKICEDLNNCNIKGPETKRSCKVMPLTEEQLRKKERGALFDVYVRILKEEISSSEKLLSSVGLVNLGIPGQVDVNLTYQIKDFLRAVVYEEREIVPVETQIEFIKEIDISNLEDDAYTLFLDLTYVGQTEPAQAESTFYVGIKKPGNLLESKGFRVAIVVILMIAIVFIIVLVFFLRKRRSNQSSKSVDLSFP